MIEDKELFDRSRDGLGQAIDYLVAAFEDRLIRQGDNSWEGLKINGSASDEPLRMVASRIYDVMETFDRVQVAMGLPSDQETRFARFLLPPAATIADAEPSSN
jgi:hypothetical protein